MKTSDIQVTFMDSMGSDITVTNAARVSFAKESEWLDQSTHTLHESDARLIAYLAKHNHWSPFAHTSLQFRVKAPIFVARQLVKHQVGGVWNEVSRRYVDEEPEFYFPEAWRVKPVNAKQGSGGEHAASGAWTLAAVINVRQLLNLYNEMIKDGVAPEQARMVLPQNMMTEWIWTGSLVFWARVCSLRLDPHSQSETTDVARLIDTEIRKLYVFNHSWSALQPIVPVPVSTEVESE